MKAVMNCQDFDRRLDALLDAACAENEWREAEAHLAGCPRCRALLEGAAGRGPVLDEAGQASLTASVMRKTGGDPCGSARDRLCGFADGTLEAFERDLVAGHVSNCGRCAALADALARSAAVLPSFATLTPPEPFVSDVLSATSFRPAEPSVLGRLGEWLGRAAIRPRFSLEVAYVCTLLLAIVFGNPVKAFKETASRAEAYAQPRVEVAVGRIAAPLAAARATGETVVGKTVGRLSAAASAAPAPSGFLPMARRWWETGVVERLRSMLDAAAGWVRSAEELANDLAARLLGKQPPAARGPGEPPPAAVR
ncbi:MAG: zf-HC2 domain-containing protein [Acidobacteria bacterium]|nr:MAG: zf-HC2 domain-containing protein [Acidobacteriota bacterium]